MTYMTSRGHCLTKPDGRQHLAITVLVMGWSWAPFLAHSALTDILDGIHGLKARNNRLVYGAPAPQWDVRSPIDWAPITWAYIDDYGAILAPRPGTSSTAAQTSIDTWATKTREGLAALKLPVHKEAQGEGLDSVLGAVMSGRPYTISIPRDKMVLMILATGHLAQMKVVIGSALERVLGQWSWALMMRRQALAILGETYRWAQEHRHSQGVLPEAVRAELCMLAALGPWMCTNLETPWLLRVFATDASLEGYGVVSTMAPIDDIKGEARYTETKGWTVCVNDTYDDVEEAVWADPQGGVSIDTFEESYSAVPPPLQPLQRVFRVAHLFSGHRRHGDLEWWLRELAPQQSIAVEVWSIDVSVDPALDLTQDTVLRSLEVAFEFGFFHAAVAGPPCSTWSRARFRHQVDGGPRPLRTRDEPWGRTDISFTPDEVKKMRLGTKLLLATLRLFRALSRAGGVFLLEHPRDPGAPPYPSIWNLDEVRALQQQSGAKLIDLDQCMFGQEAQKGTNILATTHGAVEALELRCGHQSHVSVLKGTNADGSFRTAAAQTYPSALCRAMASTIVQSLEHMLQTGTGPDPGAEHRSMESLRFPPAVPGRARQERRAGTRVPVPPLSGIWLPAKRWSLVYAGKWREQEHITVQEMRTAVGLLRHLARSRQCWNRRVLILMDSMAALGVISKGRSSSPPLLRLARQAASICLIYGIQLMARYIPSEVNPADGPSRSLPVGAAPETQHAHRDRLQGSLTAALQRGRNTDLNDAQSTAGLLARARACAGYAGG